MRTWLFKTEPNDFSIRDLRDAPDQMTGWDGVRNYQARNRLRDEIQDGDRVLITKGNYNDAHGGTNTLKVIQVGGNIQ